MSNPLPAEVLQRTYSLETFASLGKSPNDTGSVGVLDGGGSCSCSDKLYTLTTYLCIKSQHPSNSLPDTKHPAAYVFVSTLPAALIER